jgi:hypothetical protein
LILGKNVQIDPPLPDGIQYHSRAVIYSKHDCFMLALFALNSKYSGESAHQPLKAIALYGFLCCLSVRNVQVANGSRFLIL